MMLHARSPGRVGVTVFVAVVVAMGVSSPPVWATGEAASQPAPAPPVTVTDLPTGVSWSEINNRGRLVGVTTTGRRERTVLWERGQVTDIGPYDAPPNPYCEGNPTCWLRFPGSPAINDRGQVVTYQEDHAVLWHHGEVTSLGGDAEASWLLDLNERGEALVLRFTDAGQVLGLWRRGTFTELSAGPLTWTVGYLSDRGHAVVALVDLRCACAESFVWHRGARRDLPAGLGGRAVNRRGQVVGLARDPATSQFYPYLWEDGELIRLPTLGSHQASVRGINDRGQIVGYLAVPGPDRLRPVLWEDGEVTEIGPITENNVTPAGINERGDVLIREHRIFDWNVAYLWGDRGLIPLPPADNPEVSALVSNFNDRGQIVGRRATRLDPGVPTLWEVHDP